MPEDAERFAAKVSAHGLVPEIHSERAALLQRDGRVDAARSNMPVPLPHHARRAERRPHHSADRSADGMSFVAKRYSAPRSCAEHPEVTPRAWSADATTSQATSGVRGVRSHRSRGLAFASRVESRVGVTLTTSSCLS